MFLYRKTKCLILKEYNKCKFQNFIQSNTESAMLFHKDGKQFILNLNQKCLSIQINQISLFYFNRGQILTQNFRIYANNDFKKLKHIYSFIPCKIMK
ncbi:hypothetical protein pb186bvf_003119 [Paramecium bursaria]